MWRKPKTMLNQWERFSRANPDFTHEEHARMLGNMPMDVYRNRMMTAEKMRANQPYFSLGQPIELEGDYIIMGDVHVPFTDLDWVETAIDIGRKHLDTPKLILAGDFLNNDNFSQYPHLVSIPTWAQERDMAREVFHACLDVFAEIYVIMGNHERRAQRMTNGAYNEVDIFGMITSSDKVTTTNYGWLTVKAESGTWRITHPRQYGINQLTLADTLAQKYDQHIISFHEHHLSIGWDRLGRHVIVNGGCMVDPEKLAYVSLDDSKGAAMKQGFVMLKNGTPYVFGNAPITDWSKW